jgi:hypothetical protein
LKKIFLLGDVNNTQDKGKAPEVVRIEIIWVGVPADKSLGLSCRLIDAPTGWSDIWAVVG